MSCRMLLPKKTEKEKVKERKNREKRSNTATKEKSVKKNKMKVEDSETHVEDEECFYCEECYSVSIEGSVTSKNILSGRTTHVLV
ncbi:hypothetical protein J437_LFUL012228 [Ladona fulva]|uniref:Uncharacterized protein n=1 Tax=Ladona fulva TaxID=123851 RepID=A0A8K0KJ76_LADFU|nr:hypothetical protein J437_LFUL012228 [Ladona fulva]